MKRYYLLALSLVLVGAGCTTSAPQVVPVQQDATVPAQEAPAEETVATLQDGFFRLDAMASRIAWKASKVRLSHNGTVTAREGYVRIEGSTPTEGSVLVDMNTLKDLDLEGEFLKKLEGHLRSPDFFDVEQYPVSSFVITSLVPLKGIEGNNYRVDGQLTIKNITKDLSFSADVKEFDGGLRLVGRAVVDRTAYDIKFGSGKFFQNLGDSLIDDEFYLDLDLTFMEAEEEAEAAGDAVPEDEGTETSDEIRGS